MMGQDVTLGGLALMLDGMDVEYPEGFSFRLIGEDATLGQSESVTSVLLSMLTDGSLVSYDRSENRSPSFIVEVTAENDDGLALAKGEAALRAVCKKPAELVWKPPQAGAVAAVFDVVHSDMPLQYSDIDELEQTRGYRLTFNALPFARSQTPTEFEALDSADLDPTIVSVNTADATTGWTSSDTISDVGTALRFTQIAGGASSARINAVLSFAAGTLTDLNFVRIEYRMSDPTLYLAVTTLLDEPIDTDWRRAWIRVTNPALATSLTIEVAKSGAFGAQPAPGDWFEIRDVSASEAAPAIGSRWQLVENITVSGSERTQGSIDIHHPSSDLDDVLVYTRHRDGSPYNPAVAQWITSPAGTPDALAVSGKTYNTASPIVFYIPAESLPPGDYHVIGRIASLDGINPIRVSFQSGIRPGGGGSVIAETGLIETRVTGPEDTWVLRHIGTLTLPSAPVGPDGEVFLVIIGTYSSWLLDSVWLCKTDGNLTIVEGVDRPHLKIVAPSLEAPSGAIWAANDANLTDSYGCAAQCLSREHHDLDPGDNLILTVTTGATDAQVSATAYPRWSNYPSE
jgi:hypothetical protein